MISNVFQCIPFSVLTFQLLRVKYQKTSNNPLHKKSYHRKTTKILVNLFAQSQNSQHCQPKSTSLLALPESESSNIDVKLKFSNFVYVCFISLFLYAFYCGWCILRLQSLYHKVFASEVCMQILNFWSINFHSQ